MTLPVLALFQLYLTFSVAILLYINNAQPSPYMDEIFHVPQAQQYCNSNFSSWDPMITTLPGLYFATVGLLHPASVFLGEDICTTFWLRCVNVLFMCGNFYLIYMIYRKLHQDEQDNGIYAAVTALTLSLFPVMYFFTFLYYTDPGSTFFVLLMYLFYLHGNKFVSAIFGAVAILFRQTNVIWIMFCSGLSKVDVAMDMIQLEKKDIDLENSSDWFIYKSILSFVFQRTRQKPSFFFKMMKDAVITQFWYLLVLLGFAEFVYLNNGIVVGDRSNHEACLNFPQVYYFFCMSLFFSSAYMISPSNCINFLKFSFHKFWFTAIFALSSWVLVFNFTYVHKYLLSDNRHLAFYVWSKIYKRHEYVKYALIPVYYFAAWSFIQCLKHKFVLWKKVFAICLLACTVPQKLMEFRYFIIPYLIFRLNMKRQSWGQLLVELLLYVVVNAATVYLFVNKPLKWDNSDDVQRFMW